MQSLRWEKINDSLFEKQSPNNTTPNSENAAQRATDIKVAAAIWGDEITHHCLAERGLFFASQLAATAKQLPDWRTQALPRFQQLVCRRIYLSRGYGRRKLIHPLDLTDLKNARRWRADGFYVKDKDPEEVQLPLRLLSPEELPSGHCFNQFGLICREGSSVEVGGSHDHVGFTEGNAGTADIVVEEYHLPILVTNTTNANTTDFTVDKSQVDPGATKNLDLMDPTSTESNDSVSQFSTEPIDHVARRSSRVPKTSAIVRPIGTNSTQEEPWSRKMGGKIISSRRKADLNQQLAKALQLLRTSEPAASTEVMIPETIQALSAPERTMLGYDPNVVPAWDPSDQEFLKQAMSEIHGRVNTAQSSRGAQTAALLLPILEQCQHPATGADGKSPDVHLLSGREAHALLKSFTPDIPIITQQQQHFQWDNPSSPMEEFFERMECPGSTVWVQVPSRDVKETSGETQELLQVKRRLLSPRETDDPWNVLDCRCPVPHTLPDFLSSRNCQLLPRLREAVLCGKHGGRVLEGAKWKYNQEWSLVSQGGHCTAPHMDSYGVATWLTVQQGLFGFAWMSRPTNEQREEWMKNPQKYEEGQQWRYWVLRPGQTLFFPAGTIHTVFRIRAERTLVLGGHVLQWSNIEQWMDIVDKQILYPNSVNEDMDDIWVWIRVITTLVKQRAEYHKTMDELQDQAESSG